MRRASWLLLVLIFATGCPKKESAPEDDRALVQQLKSGLAERDRRLTSYQLEGTVSEGGQQAAFTFFYRAPNRMRGTVKSAGERTFSFDGDRVFELSTQDKTLTTYELSLSPEKSALFLTQVFSQFAPEGFRAPVLDFDRATAKRAEHPRATDVIELSAQTRDESGNPIRVTYVYRAPALDLLEKRLSAAGGAMTLVVEEEHCDERLKLCVPKRLVQRYADQQGAVTALSRIELNSPVPAESFSLALPEGFTAKTQALVDAPAGQVVP